MRIALFALFLALNAQCLFGQSNSSSSTGQSFNPSSSTGQSINQTSSTGQPFNPSSSTGQSINQTSSTGQSFNPSSSTGQSINQTSSTGQSFNPSSSTGQSIDQSCFNCNPLAQCNQLAPWTGNPFSWPRPSIRSHQSTNQSIDQSIGQSLDLQRCADFQSDFGRIINIFTGADAQNCSRQILNFTCSYLSQRSIDHPIDQCFQPIDQQYQTDCLQAVSCLDRVGQIYVNQSKFCSDFDSFLNRNVTLPDDPSTHQSTGGKDDGQYDDDDGFNSAQRSDISMVITVFIALAAVMAL